MLARALGVIALLLLPFAGQAAEQIDFGRYHALVIGINAYEDERLSRLETPVNDASAVHDLLLREYGFESRLLLNPTRDELVGALEKLRNELSESDNLLIYYAGHGQLDAVTDEGFWLPVDAESDDRTKWVPISRVTSTLKGMFAKHVLVVADSCYSGALTREGPVVRPGGAARDAELRRISGLRARMALTSGGLEPVYDGGGDGYSVFARAFLEALRDNDRALDGYGLYSRLRQQVVMAAEQTPQYSQIRLSDHEGGDFIFVPKGSTVVVVTPDEGSTKPAFDERAMELAFWDAIKDGTNPNAFEEYLKKFPDGTFAGLSRLKIKELKEAKARRSREQETAAAEQHAALPVVTQPPADPGIHECDRLAARPHDPGSVAPGTYFWALHADQAVAACENAVKSFPEVVRFQYQYGRALIKAGRYVEAMNWLQKAVKRDYIAAHAALGYLYREGFGVPKDYAKARQLTQRAAEDGDPGAQSSLGFLYQKGRGVEKDLTKAAEWAQKSAEQGDAWGQSQLGSYYLNGWGVPQDYARAKQLFLKAAEQGNPRAQSNLAFLYQKGRGVEKDLTKAAEWAQKSAEQGDASGQKRLGWYYQHGYGVRQDKKEAAKLYRKAAEQGNALAYINLGFMYWGGQGVERNIPEAYFWFTLAAQQTANVRAMQHGKTNRQRIVQEQQINRQTIEKVNERIRGRKVTRPQ